MFTVDEIREMPLTEWIWIEVNRKTLGWITDRERDLSDYMVGCSGYYKRYHDYHEDEFVYGWPGCSFSLPYDTYGKDWVAFNTKEEAEEWRASLK